MQPTSGLYLPVRLRRNHHDAGRSWATQHVLQALDEQEVTQMADLEGWLQAVLREAPRLSAHRCVAHQNVQRPVVEAAEDKTRILFMNWSDLFFFSILCDAEESGSREHSEMKRCLL